VLERWQRGALLAGGAGLLACAVAAVAGAYVEFFRSYLLAYNLCLGAALGCLAILMLQYLTGGTWGFILRRPLEAGTRTLPLLALLFLPLALAVLLDLSAGHGVSRLYLWADDTAVDADADLRHKYPFLNVPWFLVRAAGYFAVWIALSGALNRWSRRHDEGSDPRLPERFQNLSGPGLVLFAVTVTFASIDWVMSLEPKWYSTIYGAMFGMGQVLSGFTFCVAVLTLLGGLPPLNRVMSGANLRDLGSLMLAFVMVWAYLSFSQYLLIWSGNLPEEVPWYLVRFEGGWKYVGLALVLFHFALPFVLLLMADLKRNRKALAGVALLVLFMRVVDLFWLIVPGFSPRQGLADHLLSAAVLLDLAAVVGVGGLWLGVFLWQLRTWPLLPVHAPHVEEGPPHA
jgi:hypothetical protein